MSLHINDFVIQAQFEEEVGKSEGCGSKHVNAEALKEEIISECMEKLEELIQKKEGR